MSREDDPAMDVAIVLRTTKRFILQRLTSKKIGEREAAEEEIAQRVSASIRGRFNLVRKSSAEIGMWSRSDWQPKEED